MATQPMLDDDGQPLPLFGFLNAHDAFRRDLPRFAGAAERLAQGELGAEGIEALRHHWSVYRSLLEDHHGFEDRTMFPSVATGEPSLKALIDDLTAHHDDLHELLPQLTALLDAAPEPGTAPALRAGFESLRQLLEPHFAAEEAQLVPVLRAAMAGAQSGGPPQGEDAPELTVPSHDAVPFAVEHLDPAVRTAILPLFPGLAAGAPVDEWLVTYRDRLARWAG